MSLVQGNVISVKKGREAISIKIPWLCLTEISAGHDGQTASGKTKIDTSAFNSITFSFNGASTYGGRASGTIMGSKDGINFSDTLYSKSNTNENNITLNISEYAILQFTIIYTAGSYAEAGMFKDVVLT